jgi:cytidyltransferase-like protein
MTTALFLGRFQPPHVGHILTIRKLAQRFDKVIVGVTEAGPSVMQISEVIAILELLLPENFFETIAIRGSVEDGTAELICNFDVCCSGNPQVLARMAAKGFKTEFTERSLDSIFSGTRERQLFIEAARGTLKRDLVSFGLQKTANLRPIEKINPSHFAALESDILASGVINKPIIADRVTLAVLDGSHRYAFLVKHGYEMAPVLLCDYDDESIFVGNHLLHRFSYSDSKWINKNHVRATAISGELYPPRTTRHFFPFRKIDYPVNLSSLGKSSPNSINSLCMNVSTAEEILANEHYLAELELELATIHDYIREQHDVQKWLRHQNAMIQAADQGRDPQ